MVDDERRRRRIVLLQRHLLNPLAKVAARLGIPPEYVLVETTGRRSGKRRRTVVGMHVDGATGWVVAEHGRHAGYVRNLEARRDVRVCVRRRWRPARATVLPDDDPVARLASFATPAHAAAVTRFGTDLLTVRFDFTDGS
jgi:deazaflavin-dependent oxidoreductase (nitroreductase family)